MKKLLSLYFFCTLLIGCVYDAPLGKLYIYNTTKKSIFVLRTCSDSITDEYPLFPPYTNSYDAKGNKMQKEIAPDYMIKALSKGSLAIGGSTNNPLLMCEDKKIYLFFITEKTMLSKTWGEICKGQIYEKKMLFTEHELDSINWMVIYK